MSDTNDRDAFTPDRLPDVRSSRPAGGYTAFHAPRPLSRPVRRAPDPEESAWWETDEPAQLPDAQRWRPGSVISGVVPLAIRAALEQNGRSRSSTAEIRSGRDDIGEILGDSRYRASTELPAWTESDLARERSSWLDETTGGRNGRRAKRGKRDRPDRQDGRDRRGGAPGRG